MHACDMSVNCLPKSGLLTCSGTASYCYLEFLVFLPLSFRVVNLVGLDRDRDGKPFGSHPIYTTYRPPPNAHQTELGSLPPLIFAPP